MSRDLIYFHSPYWNEISDGLLFCLSLKNTMLTVVDLFTLHLCYQTFSWRFTFSFLHGNFIVPRAVELKKWVWTFACKLSRKFQECQCVNKVCCRYFRLWRLNLNICSVPFLNDVSGYIFMDIFFYYSCAVLLGSIIRTKSFRT